MAEQTGASQGPVTVEVVNDRDRIEAVGAAMMDLVESFGYPKASRFAIKLAYEEAITNAFQHGHAGLDADLPVRLTYEVGPEQVRIEIEDRGPGFDIDAVPDPTLDENLVVPHGRGLMLMRSYMTSIRHNDRGNLVEMVFRRPG